MCMAVDGVPLPLARRGPGLAGGSVGVRSRGRSAGVRRSREGRAVRFRRSAAFAECTMAIGADGTDERSPPIRGAIPLHCGMSTESVDNLAEKCGVSVRK